MIFIVPLYSTVGRRVPPYIILSRAGAHWRHVQLIFGPRPITQAVFVLHQ